MSCPRNEQRLAQPFTRCEQAGLYSLHGYAKHVGNLFVGEGNEMSENNNRAIVGLQLQKRLAHPVLCLGRVVRGSASRRDIETPVERNHVPAALQSVQ